MTNKDVEPPPNGDFVVLVLFDTSPEQHSEVLALLHRYINEFLKLQPGFIESRLNEKLDGSGYMHFARWQTESAFRAFADKAQSHPLLPEIRKIDASASFYQVARYYAPNDESTDD